MHNVILWLHKLKLHGYKVCETHKCETGHEACIAPPPLSHSYVVQHIKAKQQMLIKCQVDN